MGVEALVNASEPDVAARVGEDGGNLELGGFKREAFVVLVQDLAFGAVVEVEAVGGCLQQVGIVAVGMDVGYFGIAEHGMVGKRLGKAPELAGIRVENSCRRAAGEPYIVAHQEPVAGHDGDGYGIGHTTAVEIVAQQRHAAGHPEALLTIDDKTGREGEREIEVGDESLDGVGSDMESSESEAFGEKDDGVGPLHHLRYEAGARMAVADEVVVARVAA